MLPFSVSFLFFPGSATLFYFFFSLIALVALTLFSHRFARFNVALTSIWLCPSPFWRLFCWRLFDVSPRRFGVSLLTSIWRCLSPFWRIFVDVYLTFPLAALAFLFWRLIDVVCPSPFWRFCSDVSLTPYTPRHFWRFIGRLTAAEVWSSGIQPICITF